MTKAVLGIIGGSGIYDLPGLQNVREERVASPWGEPSSALRIGEIDGLPVVFLSRHDKGHRLSPSDINYRANIDVLKRAGVTDLVSLSACGSFKEELPPGTFVLVDQFVDRTHLRQTSFFGSGCVAHVSMAHPVAPRLRARLGEAALLEGIEPRFGGTYVCIEGPQFSTYAESMTYKGLGYSVIGMTNMPEAKLAREAELCYASLAMVTDFDCWHPDHDAVTVQDIIKVLLENAERAQGLVARLARDFPREHEPCPIGSDRALDLALITAPKARDPAAACQARRGGGPGAQSLIAIRAPCGYDPARRCEPEDSFEKSCTFDVFACRDGNIRGRARRDIGQRGNRGRARRQQYLWQGCVAPAGLSGATRSAFARERPSGARHQCRRERRYDRRHAAPAQSGGAARDAGCHPATRR